MLRILLHNVKQLFLACCFIIGTGGLHHMTRAVKLVTFEQVLPALIPVLYREICIKITVLVLCGGDFVNQFIYGSRKLFIGIECERICRPLLSILPHRCPGTPYRKSRHRHLPREAPLRHFQSSSQRGSFPCRVLHRIIRCTGKELPYPLSASGIFL